MRGRPVLRIDRKFRSHGPSKLRRLYRKRSAVERVVSRLKTHYWICQLRTRGLRNVSSHVLLCLLAETNTFVSRTILIDLPFYRNGSACQSPSL
ncbi:transposase [Candidatus Bathyarchaeota archaeon]|nr:transposase [Candidatus Bathyarchaeota archaeon]